MELSPGIEYAFSESSAPAGAIFTWFGAKLRVSFTGPPPHVRLYSSAENPMTRYANVHANLEFQRDEAERRSGEGPRVMLVGDAGAGKSSISRILLAYALRLKRSPTFVDLDIDRVRGALDAAAPVPQQYAQRTS